MPQRTRKEKQEASQRRQYRLIFSETPSAEPLDSDETGPAAETHPHPAEELSPTVKYLRTDLKKSLFLITAIFALEFILYFARIGNHIR